MGKTQTQTKAAEIAPLPRSAEPALDVMLSGAARVERKNALLDRLMLAGQQMLADGNRDAFAEALEDMERFRAERRAA